MSDKTGTNDKGEGNYAATRRFDEAQEKFAKDKKAEIPRMGKDAEKALDGTEGDELRKAEETAKAKAKH